MEYRLLNTAHRKFFLQFSIALRTDPNAETKKLQLHSVKLHYHTREKQQLALLIRTSDPKALLTRRPKFFCKCSHAIFCMQSGLCCPEKVVLMLGHVPSSSQCLFWFGSGAKIMHIATLFLWGSQSTSMEHIFNKRRQQDMMFTLGLNSYAVCLMFVWFQSPRW